LILLNYLHGLKLVILLVVNSCWHEFLRLFMSFV